MDGRAFDGGPRKWAYHPSLDSPFLKSLSLYEDDGELIQELTNSEQGTVELREGARYKLVFEDNGATVSAQTDEIQEGAYAVSFLNQSDQPFLNVGQKLVDAPP